MSPVTFVVLCSFLATINCDCSNEFDAVEEECGKLYNLNPSHVFYYFTRGYYHLDANKVNGFVNCTWRKWNFLDANGKIDYTQIKRDSAIVWKFARFCPDLVINIKDYQDAFLRATYDCEANSLLVTPESVRSCITESYEKYIEN
ncbi:hypothetical protein FQA39_LY06023 [Lamprigera yunnana]|nr:hypothetical protein FQA39_LY06023 [Lamprigera yunnana]